ncbi:MAG: NTP transferase domain-containing protein [Planctomycetota bacterium]
MVLCGGRSRRMGRAKALLPWRGRTLVEHVVATLREVTDEIVVVTSAEDDATELKLPPTLQDFGVRVVRDRAPGLGPLAGIREGLEAIDAPLAYATSTDAPFLTVNFVEAVLAAGRTAAPVNGEFVEPLAAAYERRLASEATRLLDAERRRPLFLLEAGDYLPLRRDDLPGDRSLENLNDSVSYLSALRSDAAERGIEVGTVEVEFFGLARERTGTANASFPAQTLNALLASIEARYPSLALTEDAVASSFLFSLGGRRFVRDGKIPLGPGESMLVLDAAVGG